MAKSVGNVTTLADALDRHGRDALILFFLGGHYRQPLAFSDERMEEAAQALRRLTEFDRLLGRPGDLAAGEPGPEVAALREEFLAALRGRLQHPGGAGRRVQAGQRGNRRLGAGEPLPGAAAAFAEMLDVLGLETLQERARGGRRGGAAAARRARGRAQVAGLRPCRRGARRAARARAGRCATRPRAPCWSPPGDPLREQRRARGAARTPAGVAPVGGDEALAQTARAHGAPEPVQVVAAAELETLCGSRSTRGWCARPRPIRTPTRPAAAPDDALVVALDQVQDPQNLGAVCRSAECAGAAGVVVPGAALGGGHSRGLPRVGRGGRAPARGPCAEPRRLPGEAKRAGAWVYGAEAGAARPYTDVDWRRPGRDRARLGGQRHQAAGPGRLRRPPCSLPVHGRIESLNVAAAAAMLLYEAARSRAGAAARP